MSQSYQPKPAPPQSVTPSTDAAAPTSRPQGGRPLPAAVLQEMEARFGVSFGAVRVIEGSSLARDAGMDGVAAGLEVHLADALDGASDEGRHLLAHELAHVVQQGLTEAPASAPLLDDSGLEAEADAVADRVIRGEPAAVAGRAPPSVQAGKKKTAAARFFAISSQTVAGRAGSEKAREGELAAILATPKERARHIADLLDTMVPKMPPGPIAGAVGEFIEKRVKNASTFHSLMFWLSGPTEGLREAYAEVTGGRILFADLIAAFPYRRPQGRYLADLAMNGKPTLESRISMALGLVTGSPPAPEEALRLFEEASPVERLQVEASPWWDELQKAVGDRKWKHLYRRLPFVPAPSGEQRTGARVKRLRAARDVARASVPETLSPKQRKKTLRKEARMDALRQQVIFMVKQHNGITGLKRKALAAELQKWASQLTPAERRAIASDPAFVDELNRMPKLPNSLRRQSNVRYLQRLVRGGDGDLSDKANEALAYIERKAERPWHPFKRFENFDGVRTRVDALSPEERDAIRRRLERDAAGKDESDAASAQSQDEAQADVHESGDAASDEEHDEGDAPAVQELDQAPEPEGADDTDDEALETVAQPRTSNEEEHEDESNDGNADRDPLLEKLERVGMRGAELEHQMAQFRPGAAGSSSKQSIPAKLRDLAYGRKRRGFGATAVELLGQLRGAEFLEVRSDAKLIAELKRRSGKDAKVRIDELLGGDATPVVVGRDTETAQQQKAADDAELRPDHWAVMLDAELSKPRHARSRTRVNEIVLRAHAAAKRYSTDVDEQDKFGRDIYESNFLTADARYVLGRKRLANAKETLMHHLSQPLTAEEWMKDARYRLLSPKRLRSHRSNGDAILAMARATDRDTLLETWSDVGTRKCVIPDVKESVRRELRRLPRDERVATLAALRVLIADALESKYGPSSVEARATRTLADLDQRRLDDTGKQYNHFLGFKLHGRLPKLGHWGATAASALRKEASSLEVGAMRTLLAKQKAGTLNAADTARFDAIRDEYQIRAAAFRQLRDEANRFCSLLVKAALIGAGTAAAVAMNVGGAPLLAVGGAAFAMVVLRQAISAIVQRVLEGHRFRAVAAATEATTQILVAAAVSTIDVGVVPAIAELAGLEILVEEGVPRVAAQAGLKAAARTAPLAERVATGRHEGGELPASVSLAVLRAAGSVAAAIGSAVGSEETEGVASTAIGLGGTGYGVAAGFAHDKIEEKLRTNQDIAKDLKREDSSDGVTVPFEEIGEDELEDDASSESPHAVLPQHVPSWHEELEEEEEEEEDGMEEMDFEEVDDMVNVES